MPQHPLSLCTKIRYNPSLENIFGITLKITSCHKKRISEKDKEKLKAQIKRMFCLEQDFACFHDMCRINPTLNFVYKNNCRGMLRSPSAFEDLIKTVCITNCDWRNTKKMCSALCSLDGGNFPTPKEILKYRTEDLSKIVPLGYRTKTVHHIPRKQRHVVKLAKRKNGLLTLLI